MNYKSLCCLMTGFFILDASSLFADTVSNINRDKKKIQIQCLEGQPLSVKDGDKLWFRFNLDKKTVRGVISEVSANKFTASFKDPVRKIEIGNTVFYDKFKKRLSPQSTMLKVNEWSTEVVVRLSREDLGKLEAGENLEFIHMEQTYSGKIIKIVGSKAFLTLDKPGTKIKEGKDVRLRSKPKTPYLPTMHRVAADMYLHTSSHLDIKVGSLSTSGETKYDEGSSTKISTSDIALGLSAQSYSEPQQLVIRASYNQNSLTDIEDTDFGTKGAETTSTAATEIKTTDKYSISVVALELSKKMGSFSLGLDLSRIGYSIKSTTESGEEESSNSFSISFIYAALSVYYLWDSGHFGLEYQPSHISSSETTGDSPDRATLAFWQRLAQSWHFLFELGYFSDINDNEQNISRRLITNVGFSYWIGFSHNLLLKLSHNDFGNQTSAQYNGPVKIGMQYAYIYSDKLNFHLGMDYLTIAKKTDSADYSESGFSVDTGMSYNF